MRRRCCTSAPRRPRAPSSRCARGATRGGLLRGRALAGLLGLALLGAVCAPALLVVGIKRTDAVTTSLLLTLEAPFTMLLARLLFHEHLGRRALAAAALILGGALLASTPSAAPGRRMAGLGPVFVAAAMLVWALDNSVSRTFADRDPLAVVAWKGMLGGLLSAGVALALGRGASVRRGDGGARRDRRRRLRRQPGLLPARPGADRRGAHRVRVRGRAVRRVGGRAGLGAPWPGVSWRFAAALMLAGVWLHASERHRHRHRHEPMRHEHLHTHDDGHHTHVHDPMPAGPHSHAHDHEAVTHEHEHGEDLHHRHHDH